MENYLADLESIFGGPFCKHQCETKYIVSIWICPKSAFLVKLLKLRRCKHHELKN